MDFSIIGKVISGIPRTPSEFFNKFETQIIVIGIIAFLYFLYMTKEFYRKGVYT